MDPESASPGAAAASMESLLQELAAQPGCSVEEVTGTFGGASSTPQEEEQSVSAAAGEGEKENGESEEDEGACAFEVKPIIPTKVPPVAEGEDLSWVEVVRLVNMSIQEAVEESELQEEIPENWDPAKLPKEIFLHRYEERKRLQTAHQRVLEHFKGVRFQKVVTENGGRAPQAVSQTIAYLNYKLGINFSETEERERAQKCFEQMPRMVQGLPPKPPTQSTPKKDGEQDRVLSAEEEQQEEQAQQAKWRQETEEECHSLIECLLSLRDCNLEVTTPDGEVKEEDMYSVAASSSGNRKRVWEWMHDSFNRLGVIWSERGETHKADTFLSLAHLIYDHATEFHVNLEECPQDQLETQHTLTLYYEAQVAAGKGDRERSGDLCQVTLGRQLLQKSFEINDWASNATHLGAVYIERGTYYRAALCFLAAQKMIDRFWGAGNTPERFLNPPAAKTPESNVDGASSSTGEVERSDEENENRQVAANVHLAWGRFHLDRLKQARKRHFPEEGGDCKDFSHERTPEEEITPEILFPMMSIAEVPALLSIDDFETARAVFKESLTRLKKALEFYILDGYVTEHIDILEDQSSLYRELSFFETDVDRKCLMFQRRVDPLQRITEEVSHRHYESQIRQIYYELGEIWMTIMDWRLEQAGVESKNPDMKLVAKGNRAGRKSVAAFEGFLSTFSFRKDIHERAHENLEDAYVMAHVFIGRICNRILTPNMAEAIQMAMMSASEHEWVAQYCNLHGTPPGLEGHREMSAQLAKLLPIKIARMRQEMMQLGMSS